MDYKQIQELIKGFETSNITHLELEMDALKLKLEKQVISEDLVVVTKSGIHKTNKENEIVESKDYEVKSPLVGTFYAASSPKENHFVEVGQSVNKGDTVCIIEAMKIMNEITAPINGVVSEICVKNGEVVSYDQVIIKIS